MKNRYRGICDECLLPVEPYEGFIVPLPSREGKRGWSVRHRECPRDAWTLEDREALELAAENPAMKDMGIKSLRPTGNRIVEPYRVRSRRDIPSPGTIHAFAGHLYVITRVGRPTRSGDGGEWVCEMESIEVH